MKGFSYIVRFQDNESMTSECQPSSSKEDEPSDALPSKQEQLIYQSVESKLPHIPDVGRHTTSKLRALYRSEVDTSTPEAMISQRRRLQLKHLADQQRIDEQNKKKYKPKKNPFENSGGRRGKKPGPKKSLCISKVRI